MFSDLKFRNELAGCIYIQKGKRVQWKYPTLPFYKGRLQRLEPNM